MRLIDIDDISLRKTIACGGLSAKALWRRIQQQPTIDAVSVVRCKDCRKSHIDGKTTHYLWCTEWGRSTDVFGYCERGEREGE